MSDLRAPLEAPEGTRDLLFDGALRLRRCEGRVADLLSGAGFAEVIPPVVEHAELFADLPALVSSDRTGRLLGVRADFTEQIARIAATRLRDRGTLRLWYRGPVVRDVPSGRMVPRERLQCGFELVGVPGAEADAEVLGLAADALAALGLDGDAVRISVGSTAYFAALLDRSGLGARDRAALRDAIDRKDKGGAAAIAASIDDARTRDAIAFLAAPEAQADVLERARALAPDEAALAAIERLAQVVALARPKLGERLEIDLGEVRGVGYYTGLVFNAYAAGAPGPVGGGGRYDTLLARFGDARPAVGCSLDLDAVAPLARLGDAS